MGSGINVLSRLAGGTASGGADLLCFVNGTPSGVSDLWAPESRTKHNYLAIKSNIKNFYKKAKST